MPREGNDNPLQYSCLENPMNKETGGLESMGLQRVGHNWAQYIHTTFSLSIHPPMGAWLSPYLGYEHGGAYIFFWLVFLHWSHSEMGSSGEHLLPALHYWFLTVSLSRRWSDSWEEEGRFCNSWPWAAEEFARVVLNPSSFPRPSRTSTSVHVFFLPGTYSPGSSAFKDQLPNLISGLCSPVLMFFWFGRSKAPLLCYSVQLYLTLCDPIGCSIPGFPIYHQLPEPAQSHIHRVSDTIQPSHPLSYLSPPFPSSRLLGSC